MVRSKNQLKKMFLKILYEILFGEKSHYTNCIHNIVPIWMDTDFKIKMIKEEIQLAYQGIQELRTSGLIVRDPRGYGEDWVVLTPKGKEIVEKQRDPDIYGLQLEQVIKNTKLLSRCSNTFNNDNYETAIFIAYKLVEEEVRSKADLAPSDIGETLMTKALHPKTGKLTIPSCAVPHEQEGVYNLFKGSIAFFKNPTSHRTVNFSDRMIAIKIIALAEVLLQILSTAQMKRARAHALDLKEKLKKPILPSLTRKEKLAKESDSKLIDIIYGPIYTEIDHFLSKKDKFTVYNPSQYQGILAKSKHWFDTIEPNLHEEIEEFYNQLQEFNSLVRAAERIIPKIITRQISDFSEDRPRSVHVELETDTETTIPTLAQILIRKTTPEKYYQAQGILRSIKKTTYTLEILDRRVEIEKKAFTRLFKKCKKEVENHPRIAKMRELRTNLDNQGREMKKKLFKLVQ